MTPGFLCVLSINDGTGHSSSIQLEIDRRLRTLVTNNNHFMAVDNLQMSAKHTDCFT
ncbi:hypothetical protein Runsl_2081 [Runella slithyformis DSM 19594]|uniref:Uncharacterized protein n=1 Tax=Runella slithyformis (strain ATCC 29530 / DSM 19594 / LMG 11500 / NCIMB 11436 / LSU 4) TaxID=761193 RepID=A0A7U3ZJQ1_RUNSL|nr:hypothetical protein Runsl_2081 [Runella slithyformis DSM 19594]